jgi:choline dehydrogenase-like flavoprotein
MEPDPLAPLRLVDARHPPKGNVRLDVDAVIVGSGASGAVVAYELASRGRSVVVLEAGAYHPSSEFTEENATMTQMLFQDGARQTNVDGDFLLLQGACVGGSTVVNGAVCFRTPDWALERWRTRAGLDLTTEVLTPYFEKVEKRLSIHRNASWEINSSSQKLVKGCDSLGWSWRPLSRNTRECLMTGYCIQGCATDRKQSMLVTYLPWGIEQGVQLYADTRVERILVEDGRAVGVVGRMIDPATGATLAEVEVHAKTVVLCAGATGTPLLLLRNGLCNGSGQVGRNLAVHPSSVVFARFDETLNGFRGATMGAYCDQFEAPDTGAFVLEGCAVGADALALISTAFGAEHVRMMEHYTQLASMITLIEDENVGWIEWSPKGGKRIHYRLSENDKPRVRAALKASARVYFAAGAQELFLPTIPMASVRSLAEAEAFIDRLDLRPQSMSYVTYHVQGTCRMGADPKWAPVSPTGETFEVKQLYVADISTFPASILVNPQVTVYALATRIAEHIHANALPP